MCHCKTGDFNGCISKFGNKCKYKFGNKIPRFRGRQIIEYIPDMRGYERGFGDAEK